MDIKIVTAIISAFVVIVGYVYQKRKEHQAEIRKKQQEIYSRLVANITKKNGITGRIEQMFQFRNAKTEEERKRVYIQDPEYSKNYWDERSEIVALLFMYGTDKAIQAYIDWTKKNLGGAEEGPDLGKLVVTLRQDILPNEKSTTASNANLSIWQNPKYLKRSSQAK
jgi:hypothetical protein